MKPRDTCSSSDALSSGNDSTGDEDDLQIQSLLDQSRNHLERTQALRIRSHLLRAEDYVSPLIFIACGILSFARAFLFGDKWWSLSPDLPNSNWPKILCRPIWYIIFLIAMFAMARRWWSNAT